MNKRSTTPLAKATRKADALWQEIVCMRGRCLLCGRTAPICGHHIKGKKARPDLRHSLFNGVCVCWGVGGCHEWLHALGQDTADAMLRALCDDEQFALLDESRYEPSMGMACLMEARCEELGKVKRAIIEGNRIGSSSPARIAELMQEAVE